MVLFGRGKNGLGRGARGFSPSRVPRVVRLASQKRFIDYRQQLKARWQGNLPPADLAYHGTASEHKRRGIIKESLAVKYLASNTGNTGYTASAFGECVDFAVV